MADLLASAEEIVAGDPEAIVLSRSDFDAALSLGVEHGLARGTDALTTIAATQLSALAGDPGTLGVVARLRRTARGEPTAFSGSLFLVLDDATVDEGRGVVEAERMSVAAVELSGSAAWAGAAARFATAGAAFASFGQACCGPETVCVPSGTEPGGPGGPGGPIGPVDPGDGGPYLPASDYVGTSLTPPRRLGARDDTGRGRVGVVVYNTGPAGGLVPIGGDCVTVRAPGCGIALPICGSDSGIFSPGDDPGANSSSDPCGGRGGGARAGHDVPEICTQGQWESLPAECGGWCESCGAPYDAQYQLPPGCAVARPFDDEGACHPQTEGERLIANAALQLAAGWISGQEATQCSPSTQGDVNVCVVCDDGGNCHQEVRRPDVNPYAAGGSTNAGAGADADAAEDADDATDDAELGRDWKLDGSTITADGNPPTETSDDVVNEVTFDPVDIVGDPPPPQPQPPPKPKRDPFDRLPPNPAPRPETTPSPSPSQQTPAQSVVQQRPPTQADPVTVADGRLVIDTTDLSFVGPVEPLEFVRHYTSQDGGRSCLGSAWDHNWSARLVALNADTMPTWAAPYCAGGADEQDRTALLAYRSGTVELFVKDLDTQLFMPSAGSTDTILRVDDGWMRRSADGAIERYDAEGQLRSRRDRFGNGFVVDVEPTPLKALYDHYWPIAVNQTLAHRRFALLAWLLELGPRPSDPAAYQLDTADYALPPDPVLATRLAYARGYLLNLADRGPAVENRYGFGRERPTRVTDDLGRQLVLDYRQAAPAGVDANGEPLFDFNGTPDAELLVRVSGPADTAVSYRYGQPLGHPAELNQVFLVHAERSDGTNQPPDVARAAGRTYDYEYRWPRQPGGPLTNLPPVAPWDAFADDLEQRFLAYYRTFVGCLHQAVFDCNGQLVIRPLVESGLGNPALLARQERLAIIGSIAAHIETVVRSGRVESETRYDEDPFSSAFGRAVAQRYGSSTAAPAPGAVPPDGPNDRWRTTLPKAVFGYADAGPASSKLRTPEHTEVFLPGPLRRRYPLELRPPSAGDSPRPVAGKSATANWCDYDEMERRRRLLPGWAPTYPYAAGDPALAAPTMTTRLQRTWLTPAQLTLAQASDPTHNDLLSAIETVQVPGSGGAAIQQPERITGRRTRIAVDANRICRWTRTTDRDGDVHYYGLNYRGDLLVDALRDRGADDEQDDAWAFHERFVTADGDPVLVRGAQRGTVLDPGVAATRYRYDVVDPSGSNGWDARLPAYWTRRRNVVRIDELAAVSGAANDHGAAGGFVPTVGRYQTFGYEPLFNQVRGFERGAVELRVNAAGMPGPTDVPVETFRWVMDYQELSLDVSAASDGSIVPLLDELAPWGFDWGRTANGYDTAMINDWQLRLRLFGVDLNGDGRLGNGPDPHRRGAGRPVLVVQSGLAGTDRASRLVWNSSGRLAHAVDPDGGSVRFDYYPLTPAGADAGRYGTDVPPATAAMNPGFAGLLARVQIARNDGAIYPVAFGPPRLPCSGLPGPYQWLLPDTATGSRAELQALGLHVSTIDAILAASSPQSASMTLGHSVLGLTRRTWTDGVTVTIRRDTDGRVLAAGTPSRLLTAQLDVDGQVMMVEEFASDGTQCGRTEIDHDEEGRVLATRQATGPAPAPVVEHRYRYAPEGAIVETVDPVGLVTTIGFDAAKRPTSTDAADPTRPVDRRRQRLEYNDDGLVRTIISGDAQVLGGPELVETRGYDGFGRVVRRTDPRGFDWHLGYLANDRLSRLKRDDQPYPGPIPATLSWEVSLDYDDFGALTRRIDGGVVTDRWRRTPAGRGWRSEPFGAGPVFTTFDLTGEPVWTVDGEGNQTIRTWDPNTMTATEASIMIDGLDLRTVITVRAFDAVGNLARESSCADGAERITVFERGPDSQVRRVVRPDGSATRFETDWLGRVTASADELDARTPPSLARATLIYDGCGRPLLLTDPDGETTHYVRDAFGAVQRLERTGAGDCTWEYDQLGRERLRDDGTSRIRTTYDVRGDRVREEYAVGHRWRLLNTWDYDDLGRTTRGEHRNPAAGLSVADGTVVRELGYDTFGRLGVERLVVGAATPIDIAHRWVVAGNAWQRSTDHTCGVFGWQTSHTYDLAGRLHTLTSSAAGAGQHAVDLTWLGTTTAGRRHTAGGGETFVEATAVDAFAMPWRWASRSPLAGTTLRKSSATRDAAGRYGSARHDLVHLHPNGPTTVTSADSYGYDRRGDLATFGDSTGLWTYDREPGTGMVSSVEDVGTARWQVTAPRDPGHELRSLTIDGTSIRVGHDVTGRVTTAGVTGYRWDPAGRLAAVRRGGSLVEGYLYDDVGRMVATVGTAGGSVAVTSLTGWDGDQPVVGYDAVTKPLWQARWGGHVDELLEVGDLAGGDPFIALTDQSSNIIGLWQPATDQMRRSAAYTPEGRASVRDETGTPTGTETGPDQVLTLDVPFSTFGAYRSAATGLVFLRNRWYSPALGEFLTTDPLGPVDGFDLYQYAAGDPANGSDPYGLADSIIGDIKSSLQSWQRGVGAVATAAGGFVTDVDSRGLGSGYTADALRTQAAVAGTIVATAIQVVGDVLAIGPALVVAAAEVPTLLSAGAKNIAGGVRGVDNGLTPGERITVGSLQVLQGLGNAAQVVLFVEGAASAVETRLNPRIGGFSVGEIKPLNNQQLRKAMGQAHEWDLPNRANGDFGVVQYEGTGDVWIQRYRWDPADSMWKSATSDYLGKIEMPNLPPAPRGLAVEGPIRDLVSKRTGIPMKQKLPNAHGPDLVPIGPPLPLPPRPPLAPPGLGGFGTRPPKGFTGR